MRTGARAAERSQNLVAVRTAQNFDDGHVGAGWLEQDSRQRTRDRVALGALFLFLLFWSPCAPIGTTPDPNRGAAGSNGTRDQRVNATDPSHPIEHVDLLDLADPAPQEPMEGNRSRGGTDHRELSTGEPARKNHTVCVAVDEQFV